MTSREIIEYLEEQNPEAILFDGLEHALVGVGSQYPNPPVAIYEVNKILQVLQKEDGMDAEEAQEWYDFNIGCLHAGEHTPIIMDYMR